MPQIKFEDGEHELVVSGRQIRFCNVGPSELEIKVGELQVKVPADCSRLFRIEQVKSVFIRTKIPGSYEYKVLK